MACPGQHVYTPHHFFTMLKRIPYPHQEYTFKREPLTDDLKPEEVYGTPYGFVNFCSVFTITSPHHEENEYALIHAKHVDTGVERLILKPIPPRCEWDSLEHVLAPTGMIQGAYVLTVDTRIPPDEPVILKGEHWRGIPFTQDAITAWHDFLFPYTFQLDLPAHPYDLERLVVRTARHVYAHEGGQSDLFSRFTRLSTDPHVGLKAPLIDKNMPFDYPYAHVIFYHLTTTFQLGDQPRTPTKKHRKHAPRHA